jgi:hypothetical protein
MPGNRKQSNVHSCDSIHILIQWQEHKGMGGQSALLVQKYEELYKFKNPNYSNLQWCETTWEEAGQLKKQNLSFNTLQFITPHTYFIAITKHSITLKQNIHITNSRQFIHVNIFAPWVFLSCHSTSPLKPVSNLHCTDRDVSTNFVSLRDKEI